MAGRKPEETIYRFAIRYLLNVLALWFAGAGIYLLVMAVLYPSLPWGDFLLTYAAVCFGIASLIVGVINILGRKPRETPSTTMPSPQPAIPTQTSTEPDVRFRLNHKPFKQKKEYLTFVEVENKTGFDMGIWIDLCPVVEGKLLGDLYTNRHYNGERMWILKKWATFRGTRFGIKEMLDLKGVTFKQAKRLSKSKAPGVRATALAIRVCVRYKKIHAIDNCVIEQTNAYTYNLPEFHHYDFVRKIWITDVALPKIYEDLDLLPEENMSK